MLWTLIVLLLLFWLLGFAFQNRALNCVGPQEGWGLMEGGVVTVPLYGAFLFAACTSMAMLSAAYVRPVTPTVT